MIKFLELHPLNGKLFKEFNKVEIAEDELDYLEFKVESMKYAKEMEIDQAEAILRVEIGSEVSKMTTKEIRRDLIVMAEIALKKGMPTGDVKANLKDLIPTPHAELHTILRRQGDEVAKTKLIKDLSKVNSVNDLMRMWIEEFSPDGRFTYNYETAKIFQELDSLLEEMTGISKNIRKRDIKYKDKK